LPTIIDLAETKSAKFSDNTHHTHFTRLFAPDTRNAEPTSYLAFTMNSNTDTEEPLYEMQEEGGVPTSTSDAVSVESDLSSPSMDKKIILDMKVMHAMQSRSNSPSKISNSEPSPDGISAAGVSNASSWVSNVLAPGGLSILTATCTVAYLTAASNLIPWAFAQGGPLLTSIVLGAVIFQTYIATSFILEACARAQALDLLMTDGSLPRRYTLKIRERKYELSLLTKTFLGEVGSLFFSCTTLGDLYGMTWALCSIFGNAFADMFPLGDAQDGGYMIYIAIFMAVTVPLSCASMEGQLWIQMSLMMARFVGVILMVGTIAGAYGADEPHFGSQVGPANDVALAIPSNIVQVTMTCIFATGIQFSVPTMASESRSKTRLSQIFGMASTLSYFANIFVGILLAVFFGQDQPESSNLNWVNYHGGAGEGDSAMWATAISGYIVLFTAIDGIAIYSLIAISTGDILMGAVYGDRVHDVEKDWRVRTVFRLLGSVPQAIGAMFLSDLGVIAKFAGIFTILSYTVCPALLALSSHACMKKKNLPLTTYYSSYLSSRFWSYGLLLLSAALIGGVAFEQIA
jgi:hypothetical protein